MAVDVIARALAAKASQGGGGNKVPIDISGVMDEVLSAIDTSYYPVRDMSFPFPRDLAKSIGGQIAAAGKDNVDLFFKAHGTVPFHHAFASEMYGLYAYFFLLGAEQGLYSYVKRKEWPSQTLSFVMVLYNPERETMEDLSVFFISGDETPLYITGTENNTFHDLESVKTILDFPGNQIIETKDAKLDDHINSLFKGVINIETERTDVTRIEHDSRGVILGSYAKYLRQWGYIVSIDKSNKTIVDHIKILNGTLHINTWGPDSTLKEGVSIVFSNGHPSYIFFTPREQIELTPNVPLVKQGLIDESVPEAKKALESILPLEGSNNIFSTNFIPTEEMQIKNYQCACGLFPVGIQLLFFSKESVVIPAGRAITIKIF